MSQSRKDFLKTTGLASLALTGFNRIKCEEPAPETSDLIMPEAISWNAKVGLIAPASPIYNTDEFDEMLVTLKDLGFQLTLGEHVRDRNGYLAGKDEDRASDLHSMFSNDQIEAVLCIRGGWGCNRILPLLDYDLIRENPKPLIGFSDITSLHNALLTKSGLVSFHGPVGKSDWNGFTRESFEKALIDKETQTYSLPEEETDAFVIRGGKAEGRLLGGNLSVLTAMIGSEYLPDFKDSILFLEDVGEDVYRMDRMLTHLKLSGILDDISGFIFGKCTSCDAGSNSLTLKQVFDDHIKPLNIPAYYGAMISHESQNVTIPVGIRAELDAEKMEFTTLSAGVK